MSPKWRWHQMIHHMIAELNMTEKEVYKMNYISSLNWQSYFYERGKVQEALSKQK
jgi:hypothetical protein